MFKILISLCAIALTVASPVHHIHNDNLQVNFVNVESIKEYKKANPSLGLIPLSQEVTPFGVIRYTLGGRVGGDRLVAYGKDGQRWPNPQDVKLQLRYPNSGIGAVVSFVQVVVNQSSNNGQAYITGGGIGHTYISIIVEANVTTYFEYQAEIYGY